MTQRRAIDRAYALMTVPGVLLLVSLMLGVGVVVPLTYFARAGRIGSAGMVARIAIFAAAGGIVLSGVAIVFGRWKLRGLRATTASGQSLPCVNCGYTLMLTEPRCPECGVVVDAADVRREWAGFRKRAGMVEMER